MLQAASLGPPGDVYYAIMPRTHLIWVKGYLASQEIRTKRAVAVEIALRGTTLEIWGGGGDLQVAGTAVLIRF